MLRSTTSNLMSRRSLATVAKTLPKIEVTELSNGITVASEYNPDAKTSSIGLVYAAGSSAENLYNNGVSNLWTNYFTHSGIQQEAAKKGFSLSSKVNRESQSFTVNTLSGNTQQALNFLQSQFVSKLSGSLGSAASTNIFSTVKKDTLKQITEFEENNHSGLVLEHLHSTAFQNTPLALPTRGTVETVETLIPEDLETFANEFFHSKNTTIVATGNTPHDELVKAIDSELSLNTKSISTPIAKSSFLGSEVRLRDDTLPKAWISLAVEGESSKSPNYLVANVAANIFGSYVANEPRSRLQGIKLLDNIQEYRLCDSFNHFSYSYKDTGLWGFSTEIGNVGGIDDMIHFTLKQWNRLTISITETELERGKALLKLKLGQANSLRTRDASLLGNELIENGGLYLNTAEVFKKIDSITTKDIKNWAGSRVWDQDIAISGTGQIEDLLDYMRMRNDMSMLRW
ncbi:similar to Saccharomyces cerevisiae YBL045C COR1 Core subunit of the ubiquinol-cytochrome c reductase complex (bc1 complex) [Maudiozyma barnettii]|uniref:Similar to Saccharomyces cerevisiae YBL045C COR1 Core subunit of the ubiquinol-cytochrome c reductase complex (Bc1 complex) n=1 Tax=Maudiozyma barnettii TaxID=61262 RepID=A0A8H2VGC8_9SACH|nr:ubiquinol--cytochrome-c reductase subunit COR1 [Kazachstania barnettii]CAB4254986.1 similar to Saccharomyces cerevisiae YBL045C COR1 Core subunit of the ubiquinol-cytochrome c reductase complex (bc1 complex) [Kazachstania barnettii]CAD1783257.1 similar to Saccharomyces cerevisiae YBL045C COR1 Core subunit of the ubiquinol-cytochrome c reductase complex (bc1 complex) [Kazachstania barnettii]